MPRRGKRSLRIEMLPACEGDCLLLEYCDGERTRRILVDGGRQKTYETVKKRLEDIAKRGGRTFELFVITHVDRDHIEGAITLLEDRQCPVTFRDIWFNGYAHLKDPDATKENFGGVMGERLTTELIRDERKWNAKFKRRAVYTGRRTLPTKRLVGGLELTVLSPDADKLAALKKTWATECAKAGLVPGKSQTKRRGSKRREDFGLNIDKLADQRNRPDNGHANGSSIGLLATFGRARVLLAADCHADRLITSLRALEPKKRFKLSAFKLPHHGSEKNLPRELLEMLDCDRYLISTSGAYFKHPTQSAIARVLKYGGQRRKHLFFNYKSDYTEIWDSDSNKSRYDYIAYYPDDESNGTRVVEIPA